MKKLLLVSVMMIVGAFLLPITVLAAEIEPESVTTIFGVDLTQSLLAGLTAMGSTVASLLVIYRSLKGKVTKLGTDTDGFLTSLKDKLEKVVKGEIELQAFVAEITASILSMKDVLNNTIQDLKAENGALKLEIENIREQFPIFVQLAQDIKTSEKNIESMLKIGFGNMKELVVNGYAKQIFKVGEAEDENQV
jgi:regulator of replication initiation timing